MSKRYRQLLPVPPSESSPPNSQPSASSSDEPLKRQRIGTQLACNSCRKRKIRVSFLSNRSAPLTLSLICCTVQWKKATLRSLLATRREGTMCLRRESNHRPDKQRDRADSRIIRHDENEIRVTSHRHSPSFTMPQRPGYRHGNNPATNSTTRYRSGTDY